MVVCVNLFISGTWIVSITAVLLFIILYSLILLYFSMFSLLKHLDIYILALIYLQRLQTLSPSMTPTQYAYGRRSVILNSLIFAASLHFLIRFSHLTIETYVLDLADVKKGNIILFVIEKEREREWERGGEIEAVKGRTIVYYKYIRHKLFLNIRYYNSRYELFLNELFLIFIFLIWFCIHNFIGFLWWQHLYWYLFMIYLPLPLVYTVFDKFWI